MKKRRIKRLICTETHTSGTFTVKKGVLGEIIDEDVETIKIRVQQSFIYDFKRIHMSRVWKNDIKTSLSIDYNLPIEYLDKYDKLSLAAKLPIKMKSTIGDDLSDSDFVKQIKHLIDKGIMDNALC